jgi:lambda repressor-like predicted transcriptional regulator
LPSLAILSDRNGVSVRTLSQLFLYPFCLSTSA